MTSILFKDLGEMPYEEALAFQLKHFEDIKALKILKRDKDASIITPNYFFFVSHPHVYTLGRNGNVSNILLDKKQLEEKKISFHKTNRGGDITYHGPGQIVGYPIIDLDNFFSDIHKYMRLLEEVIILTIAEYGLKGERSEGETGVWLDVGTNRARKICALGVHTSRWVTMHGFALNVTTNLDYFNGIIPCGIRTKGVTSMENELNTKLDEEEVKRKITNHFSKIFHAKFTPYLK